MVIVTSSETAVFRDVVDMLLGVESTTFVLSKKNEWTVTEDVRKYAGWAHVSRPAMLSQLEHLTKRASVVQGLRQRKASTVDALLRDRIERPAVDLRAGLYVDAPVGPHTLCGLTTFLAPCLRQMGDVSGHDVSSLFTALTRTALEGGDVTWHVAALKATIESHLLAKKNLGGETFSCLRRPWRDDATYDHNEARLPMVWRRFDRHQDPFFLTEKRQDNDVIVPLAALPRAYHVAATQRRRASTEARLARLRRANHLRALIDLHTAYFHDGNDQRKVPRLLRKLRKGPFAADAVTAMYLRAAEVWRLAISTQDNLDTCRSAIFRQQRDQRHDVMQFAVAKFVTAVVTKVRHDEGHAMTDLTEGLRDATDVPSAVAVYRSYLRRLTILAFQDRGIADVQDHILTALRHANAFIAARLAHDDDDDPRPHFQRCRARIALVVQHLDAVGSGLHPRFHTFRDDLDFHRVPWW